MNTGLVDEALRQGGDDVLRISSYKDALVDFFKNYSDDANKKKSTFDYFI